MLEKEIESKSMRHAKAHGWIAYKFTSPSKRSVPDRIFISPSGIVIFIEFKRKDGKATSGQEREIAKLREQGCTVVIFDSVGQVKFMVEIIK